MHNSINDTETMAEIAKLYMEVVGELSQNKVDDLNDALKTYPANWMVQVLKEAKAKNRNWRWCEIQLEAKMQQTKPDPHRFTDGKYGQSVLTNGDDILSKWNERKQARKSV